MRLSEFETVNLGPVPKRKSPDFLRYLGFLKEVVATPPEFETVNLGPCPKKQKPA